VTERPAEAIPNDRWQAEPDEPRTDRPGILASLWRYRLIVIAAILVGAAAGYGIAQLLPVRYAAEASLIMSDPGDPLVVGGTGNSLSSDDRQVYLAKQADIMTSNVVLARALQLLGRPQAPPSDLRPELTVAPSKDLASVSIRAAGADANSAVNLANAVGTAYEQVTSERTAQAARQAITGLDKIKARLQDQLDSSPKSPDGNLTSAQQQLASQINDLQQREQDITTQASVYPSGVELFEKADTPTTPAQPKPVLYALLGGLVGLLAAGLWAWWAAGRNKRSEAQVEPAQISDAPSLEDLPHQAQSSLGSRVLRPGVAGERARRRPGNGGVRKVVNGPDR
jgi:uncharacterized protein involved in exopolysaccharide biosynthesis